MTGLVREYGGMTPKIDPTAFIAETAVVIGDVEIGQNTSVWYGCVLRGDVHEIRIGANVNIQDGTVIHCAKGLYGTYIGDNVTVGHMALVHAATVEANAFIGMKACVMDGAVVESRAMVAAGGLVTPGKRIPAGQLWAGNPARYLRDLKDEERAHFARTAPSYVALAAEYLAADEQGTT